MKKRLLALALCLVMVSSLLPVTAFADFTPEEIMDRIMVEYDAIKGSPEKLEAGKTYHGDVYITLDESLRGYSISSVRNDSATLSPESDGRYKLNESGFQWLYIDITIPNGKTYTFFIHLTIQPHSWGTATFAGNGQHSLSCSVCRASKKEDCADTNGNCKCDDCGASIHNWQLTPTDSSLTFTCGNPGCTIGTVGVAITAHSVTLPDSPFNAQVETTGAFNEAFSGVEIGDIRYDYEDSEGVWHQDIDPIPANAKAGRYQAGVCVSGFSGNGGVAARAFSTDDGFNAGGESVFLWVKYTAADPKVTAQTGDNRPIELMMASVLVFSALAAAAFILDHKRKYSR